VGMHAMTEESLLEWITSDETPQSVFAVISRPAMVPLVDESGTTQLLRIDPSVIRIVEYHENEASEARSEVTETRLSRLTDTTLVLDHRLDSNTGRMIEAHQLRIEGPAEGSLYALRGHVDLGGYTEDERQALLDALVSLMP